MKHAVTLVVLTGFAITAGCAWQTNDFTATQLPLCDTPFTLSGRIVELASQYPVAGAQIVLLGTEQHTRADAAGYFRLCGLTPGQYQLRISNGGYETYVSGFLTVDSTNVSLPAVRLKSTNSLTEQIVRTIISRW